MWQIIQPQQRTIEELKSKLKATEERVTVTDEKVEAATEAAEDMAARPAVSWAEKTHLGSYGELHYNNLGFTYWPHPDVVFKFDYQWQDADGLARKPIRWI